MAKSIPGRATPADVRHALRSFDIAFIREIATRVGYHEGDVFGNGYSDLNNRIAVLEHLPERIRAIQTLEQIQPDQECEIK